MAASTTCPAPPARTERIAETTPRARRRPPPTKVSDQVEGHLRLFGTTDRAEGTRKCDVIDIVARGFRQWAVLAPSGQTAIDECRVAGQTGLRSQPHPFSHSRPKTFDDSIGSLHQTEYQFNAVFLSGVDCDRPLSTIEQVSIRSRRPGTTVHPIDPDHIGAEVSEDHSTERCRTKPGQLHDTEAVEWTTHPPPLTSTSAPLTSAGTNSSSGVTLNAPR